MGLLRILLIGTVVLIAYRLLKRFVRVSFYHHANHNGTRSYRYPGENPDATGPKKFNKEDIVDANFKDIH